MTRRNSFVFLSVAAECIVIVVLAVSIIRRGRMDAVDPKYISRLNKHDYVTSVTPVFPHFYEPKPNAILNDHPEWLGYNVSYSINSDALNERMEYPIEKPANTYRILVLGDSFTFGLFVNTYENYTELLETRLNETCLAYSGIEVLNLGVPGYDIGFSAERFRLRGQKYDPDLVIWFVNPISLTGLAERKTALEQQNLKEMSPEKIRLHEARGEYYYPGQQAWDQLLRETSLNDRMTLQFGYFDSFLSTYSRPLLVVSYKWSIWPAYAQSKMKQIVLQRANTWLYTSMPILSSPKELFPDRHPNALGHAAISSGILSYLESQNILRCAAMK